MQHDTYGFHAAILGRGKLAKISPSHHSFPDPLNFSRWRSSQIFYSGLTWGLLWVSKSRPMRALRSIISLGCRIPILGQTVDKVHYKSVNELKYSVTLTQRISK